MLKKRRKVNKRKENRKTWAGKNELSLNNFEIMCNSFGILQNKD
jgi:hypothetical protein